jgi:hypothetical protein
MCDGRAQSTRWAGAQTRDAKVQMLSRTSVRMGVSRNRRRRCGRFGQLLHPARKPFQVRRRSRARRTVEPSSRVARARVPGAAGLGATTDPPHSPWDHSVLDLCRVACRALGRRRRRPVSSTACMEVGMGRGRQELRLAAPLTHYLFGAAMGAAYGAYAHRRPVPTSGAVFGTTVWLAADEIAMPLLGHLHSTARRPGNRRGNAQLPANLLSAVSSCRHTPFRTRTQEIARHLHSGGQRRLEWIGR